MKLIQLATVAALTSTFLAGGSTLVSAEEVRDVTTEGSIQFTAPTDEDGELEVVPPLDPDDEDTPDVELDPEVDGTTGPLSIMQAATMNFGSQVISNQDSTYNMVAEMRQLVGTTGDENKVPYVSFAQVQDLRGTNEGWNLHVSLTDFTSGTQNNVLTGAEIEFVEGSISYETNNAQNTPSGHQNGLKLRPNAGSVPLMTADTGQGAGAASIVWGNQRDLNQQLADEEIEVVENDAIRLFIPGSTAKDAATYTSTLSWELTSTPGADA